MPGKIHRHLLSKCGVASGACVSGGGLPGRRFKTGRSSDEKGSCGDPGPAPRVLRRVDEGVTVSGVWSRKLSTDSAGSLTGAALLAAWAPVPAPAPITDPMAAPLPRPTMAPMIAPKPAPPPIAATERASREAPCFEYWLLRKS